MKRFLAVLLMAVLCFFPVAAFAAGTCVPSLADVTPGQSVYTTLFTCTADAAAATYPATLFQVDGWIIGVKTVPSGVTAPTNLYDITFNADVTGTDIMAGALADRSATGVQYIYSPQPYYRGAVTITTTGNAVNSAVFLLYITVLR